MQAAHPLPHPLQGLCPFLPNNTAQEEHRSEQGAPRLEPGPRPRAVPSLGEWLPSAVTL